MSPTKKFSMRSLFFSKAPELVFTENDAPVYLTSEDTIKGSTMDDRWFWSDHVLKLEVWESVKTDFSEITRIE